MRTFLLAISIAVIVTAVPGKFVQNAGEKRYLVFPGADVTKDEITEWLNGYASPFNVLFGPKPYVIGWIGGGGKYGPNNPTQNPGSGGSNDYSDNNSDDDSENNENSSGDNSGDENGENESNNGENNPERF